MRFGDYLSINPASPPADENIDKNHVKNDEIQPFHYTLYSMPRKASNQKTHNAVTVNNHVLVNHSQQHTEETIFAIHVIQKSCSTKSYHAKKNKEKSNSTNHSKSHVK